MQIGRSQTPYVAFVRTIGTVDRRQKKIRLASACWTRGDGPGRGNGWTASLRLNLVPRLFGFCRGILGEWRITVLGVQLHYVRSYGGWLQ